MRDMEKEVNSSVQFIACEKENCELSRKPLYIFVFNSSKKNDFSSIF